MDRKNYHLVLNDHHQDKSNTTHTAEGEAPRQPIQSIAEGAAPSPSRLSRAE
jgi:hypothetical protein